MLYCSTLLLVTSFLMFEVAVPIPKGLSGWFSGGDWKNKDKYNKEFMKYWKSNQNEEKREQGRKKIGFSLLNRKNYSWVEIKKGRFPKRLWKKNASLKLLLHSYSKETLSPSQDILEEQKIFRIGLAYGNASNESNVIVLDWTALSVEPEVQYNFVVENVPIVGEIVANFIIKLLKKKRLVNLSNIHMVGFGMGAHVAAVAAKRIQKKKHFGKVGRITGLDPAGVGFDDETGQATKNNSISLRKSDADFVDVIHCNLGASQTIQEARWKGRYGSGVQAANGGTEQFRCQKTENAATKDCHTKSCPEYFVKSIKGVKYMGCPCQDYEDFEEGHCDCTRDKGGQLMGEPCSKTANGKYFLTVTGTEKPKKKKTGRSTTSTPRIKGGQKS